MTLNTSLDKKKYEVKGQITHLLNQLAQMNSNAGLTPTDGLKNIKRSDNLKNPTEADSLTGAVFMESIIASSFNMAANDNTGSVGDNFAGSTIGLNDMAEALSEYLKDKSEGEPHDVQKRGKGTKALIGTHKTMCNIFAPFKEAALPANEPGKRVEILETLASLSRKLDSIFAIERQNLPALQYTA